ncbi:MAG: hypothetical protein KJ904_12530 [Alphaproteobacteria bacterium]|nr:hypothetical protein [Alphaproteobacteria bacterium]MBU0799188.1 hypothetical protein [Alphaproteobacteria bacterium]MBU0887979.1 hypothetical protein [Alphaproteobacteria bacterium]MBU1814798.1 hypothetical protein [Alphaproteobacteria bacterium]MBU2091174.1 hypothetical protein [Alphaproteobacteria bacterium]
MCLSLALAACATDSQQTAKASPYDKPGFTTKVDDGRLWVFKTGSKELADFQKKGEPAKQVTRIAAGPNRMTIRSNDSAVIDAYLAAK